MHQPDDCISSLTTPVWDIPSGIPPAVFYHTGGNIMKLFRSNVGLIAGTITSSNAANGQTAFWVDQVTCWTDAQGNQKSRTAQVQCVHEGELDLKAGNAVLLRTCVKTCENVGNNGSKINVTYYKVLNFLGFSPDSNDVQLSLNQYTLGGNVGSVDQKTSGNNTWYNVTLALTRSYQVNNNWQDETHWVKLVINQKMFDQNFKNGINTGDSMMVECELTTNSYVDKHQNTVLGNEFRVNRVLGQVTKAESQLLKSQQTSQQGNFNSQPQQQQQQPQQNFAPQQQQQQQQQPQQQNFQPQQQQSQQNFAPQQQQNFAPLRQ